LLRGLRFGITSTIVAAIVVLVGAQIIRDRALWLFYCMYVPMWAIAIAAVAWDLLLIGRALPLRFLMLCIGAATGMLAVGMMWAPARVAEGDASQPTLTVLQWNVQWGGLSGPVSLEKIVGEIVARRPQIICLSEAPPQQYFDHYWKLQAGPDWHIASANGNSHSFSWYRLTVLSRAPVRQNGFWPLETGVAALFEVAVPESPLRPLRVLMVDLESEPSVPRTPSLLQVAALVDKHAARGTPIDFVLGDFNTPSRFRGFDAISAAGEGYERAALWSGQWRATWPSRLVLPFRGRDREFRNTWRLSTLDIDHIWVRSKLDVVAAAIFTNFAVDHRGQTVTVRLPRPHHATP